ncbi:M42 family metallopeptidase [Methanobrevibacter wolinii]|uniref:M42 family metallopeptidase n=1 Tax=Methanobrevibacter wolinii TaxID=190977 RepID=UPI000A9C8809|nr:M42 family metallopeptidase [Methanobrevibacter wolinii]
MSDKKESESKADKYFNMDLMKELCVTNGISGYEDNIAAIFERELKDVADTIERDNMGNIICTKKGKKGKPTVMLAAHMDEIGLMVRYIDDDGFLRFTKIGGINDQMLQNQTVTIHTADGDVTGVIGSKPPHITTAEERKKVVPFDKMFIDIGAKDKEEAETMVSVGDPITINTIFAEYPHNCFMGKAIDNRAGCYVVMEVLKRVKTDATVYGVGTVQEEVGLKGARTSAFKLNPDWAFALDTTLSGDHPGVKPDEAPGKMGEGPVIVLIDAGGRGIITPKKVRDLLINTGDKYDIPYQLEVGDGGTTDGSVIHLTREGIPTGVFSVPTRYIHTPCSVASAEDIENTIELIVKAIESL